MLESTGGLALSLNKTYVIIYLDDFNAKNLAKVASSIFKSVDIKI